MMASDLGSPGPASRDTHDASGSAGVPTVSQLGRVLATIELYLVLGGLVSLSGYVADIPRLTDWANTGISIQPNTSLAVTLAGTALFSLRRGWRRLSPLLGIFLVAIGSTALFEHASGLDLGIDRVLLFGRSWGQFGVTSPGRMGLSAATAWTLIGIAVVLASRPRGSRARRWVAALALGTLGLSTLGLIGYLYGASTLYSLPRSTVIALQTATFILATSLGLVLNTPECGPLRLLTSDTEGGSLARRLIPALVLVPTLVGLVRVRGERHGYFDTAFGSATRTLVEMLLFTLLVASSAAEINSHAERRAEAERQRADLLEKERAARAEAERATRLKDEFLSTLSHELRTPLSAILGWTQILKKRMTSDEPARNALDVIERNGRAQAKLVTDLLDISRITSGTMRLEVQPVDLAAVSKAAVDSILPAAAAKDVRLEIAIAPTVPLVSGDPARLQQVVWNLLSNAVKFTPRGGRVQLGVSQVDSQVEIRVRDSGQGIAEEFLPHLFERFRQADGSTARQHGGLGIGLSIVKQLVELHGGNVYALSAGADRGATFIVDLPLDRSLGSSPRAAAPASDPAATGATDSARLAGVRVLAVDDEPDALAMIATFCEEQGASVHRAGSAQAALEQLRQQPFDVIASDIAMPGGDGYELIASLRALGIRTPALALTAFARETDRQKALTMGFQAHVTKPVEQNELIGTLVSLVEASRRPA
ncbi:MAG TPA: ATP-binding protein [Polyangiaceae bacterium]